MAIARGRLLAFPTLGLARPAVVPSLVLVALLFALGALPAGAEPVCGDGVLEPPEECDDGNAFDGDCCSSDCVPADDGTPCEDGLFCTMSELCRAGVCVGGSGACDDGIPCTLDACDEEARACVHDADDSACNDGVFCNGVEICDAAAGGCSSPASPVDCSALDTECRRGTCDEETRACITSPLASAECDRDGDGTSADEDICPHTPPGTTPLLAGCAAVDLARAPHVVLDPVEAELSEITTRLRETASVSSFATALEVLRSELDASAAALRAGRVCAGTARSAAAVRRLRQERQRFARHVSRLVAELSAQAGQPESPLAGEEDTRPVDLAISHLENLGAFFDAALERAEAATPVLQAVCAAVVDEDYLATAKVLSIDDTAATMVLEDDTVVSLPPARSARMFAPGLPVEVSGDRFAEGPVAARRVASLTALPKQNIFSPFLCLDLRVLPYQPHTKVSVSQMNHLPLEGYQNLARTFYEFENGMWFTVESKGCLGEQPSGSQDYERYSLQLVLTRGTEAWTVAEDLVPGERVGFPIGVTASGAFFGSLLVTARTQDCNLSSGCSSVFKAVSATATLPVIVLPTGGYCNALYERREFQLEDIDFVIGQPTPYAQFRPAKVTGVLTSLTLDPGQKWSFAATGYRVTGGSSSYPSPQTIFTDTEFAIYQNHDFVWLSDFPKAMVGAEVAAGLMWPHMVGVRHASFVQYHCLLPKLVRDVVDFCIASEESYYRLPFHHTGPGIWRVTQGNDGAFTHKGAERFAFDFALRFLDTTDQPILAARGGKVLSVKESIPSDSNCYVGRTVPKCRDENNPVLCGFEPCGCAANKVAILHQDGTVGEYKHLPQQGVSVGVGARVRRGQSLGRVGNTGCSSGSHLHFHAVGSGGFTVRIRLQTNLLACAIPQTGESLISSNPLYPLN